MINKHTYERIYGRLDGIVTGDDITAMLDAAKHFTSGKHYVKIRELGEIVYLDDSVGDTLACILYDGKVTTAMLCFSSQKWHDGKTWRLMK